MCVVFCILGFGVSCGWGLCCVFLLRRVVCCLGVWFLGCLGCGVVFSVFVFGGFWFYVCIYGGVLGVFLHPGVRACPTRSCTASAAIIASDRTYPRVFWRVWGLFSIYECYSSGMGNDDLLIVF
jgi:hypothetical protein